MEIEVKKIEETSLAVIGQVDLMLIVSQEKYGFAGNLLKSVKSMQKNIKEAFDPIIEKAHQAHKEAIFQKDKYLKPLLIAEDSLKQKMLGYQQEQELIRLEAEHKAQEAARKEEERLRKIKEEQERVWREKEAAQRQETARLAAAGRAEEAEKARIEAEKAKAKADERAEQAENIFIPVPIMPSKVEKISGIATKTLWKYRIVDANKIPREYMIPNEKVLGEMARATKGAIKIEGVEFYSEDILASNTKG